MKRFRCCVAAACLGVTLVQAQVSVAPSGLPNYSIGIAVPPAVAGIAPQLSLAFAGVGVNGPLGVGWSLQGLSVITRCPSSKLIDGVPGGVGFNEEDRLCLDGQRLIRTNSSGVAQSSTTDAAGLSGSLYTEFRTEKDSFARVRAYGTWSSAAANGPLYFKVWTKAGQIYEYGKSPSTGGNNALIVVGGVGTDAAKPAMVWAVARTSDTLGNYIDFKYKSRAVAWGSGPVAGSPTAGADWNIDQILYTGFSGATPRSPYNKIQFDYEDRNNSPAVGVPADREEAYQAGYKTVNVSRMTRMRAFVGSALVRSVVIGYETSPATGRSRLTSLKECFGESTATVGEPGSKCTQPTAFAYANTGNENITLAANFNDELRKLRTMNDQGEYGVLTGDFNGDGKTDILRWSAIDTDNPQNRMYLSDGDGSFSPQIAGTGVGQFNLPSRLFTSDGCLASMVMDMNADGLPDIVRFAGKQKLDGSSCTITDGTSHVFVNNGTGGFSAVAITSAVTGDPIELKRIVSRPSSMQFCGQNPEAKSAASQATDSLAPNATCRTGYGWGPGSNFYLLDVNGDGRTDIVTADLTNRIATDPLYGETPPQPCASTTCTRVFLGTATNGSYQSTTTNVANKTLYSDPGEVAAAKWPEHIADTDGDGFTDIIAAGKLAANSHYGNWRSLGNGSFELLLASTICERPIDFNGDGRSDCLMPGVAGNSSVNVSKGNGYTGVAGFNITSGLKSPDDAAAGSRYGAIVFDFNADGRDDILRWHDNQSLNLLFTSRGDGSYAQSAPADYTITRFQSGDYEFQSIIGDFTGNGIGEILRLSRNAPDATNDSGKNNLYLRESPQPPDRLLTVTSPGGLTTTIAYSSLARASATNYQSDRGGSNKAAYPLIDLTLPTQVVTGLTSETGVGDTTVSNQFAYRGLKAAADGRGLIGFRETRVEARAANGSTITTATQYLLDRRYQGMPSRMESRFANLITYDGANTLSRTVNMYCDKTAAAGAEDDVTETAPCPIGSTLKLTKPYLRKTIQSGYDIDVARTELPTVTSLNSYNSYGDPTEIKVATVGDVAGANRTYTKTTVNEYLVPTIDDTWWILGRLSKATVTSTAPDLSLAASKGTAPYADRTTGEGIILGGTPPAPAGLPPGVMEAIINLLLDDE
jgi:hypothetical protein